MTQAIVAILTAGEDEQRDHDNDGAHQLVYPVHITPVITDERHVNIDGSAYAESMSPHAIVRVLAELDYEDLCDLIRVIVGQSLSADAIEECAQELKGSKPTAT